MKILLVSDMECPALWDHFRPERVEGVDLIISCGDLKRDYLEFLVTMVNRPVFYIPGNHDVRYLTNPPEGCECIDDCVINYRGIRIGGLGGCLKYSDSAYQYTEKEMAHRVRKLRKCIRKAGGLDIFVTHAAMAGYGDAEDRAHHGFECFKEIMDRYHPQFMCHGHVHQSYGWEIPRQVEYKGIPVINAFERYIIEIPDKE